jgi:hypothetical protein
MTDYRGGGGGYQIFKIKFFFGIFTGKNMKVAENIKMRKTAEMYIGNETFHTIPL